MKISNLIKILFLCFSMALTVSCNDDVKPETEVTVEDFTFSLEVDSNNVNVAEIRVRHDGDPDLKWVYLSTDDLQSDADELIDDAILKELDFNEEVLVNSGNNRSIRLAGLLPKCYYRVIVKAVSEEGSPLGKAFELVFRTQRNADIFEVNDNWDVKYDSRTEGMYPGSTELVEYDNFKCTSSDDEPYVLAVIKKADYEAFEKNPGHATKLRTYFEKFITDSGMKPGDEGWAEVIETGDCTWQEQRLRHGEWLLFMVGVDSEGELTGLYKEVTCIIKEETPTKDFEKWLGTWKVTGYNQGIEMSFNLTIMSSEANLWYYSIGWEPDNVYAIDPVELPVEIFFDKANGNAYLVSQYVTTAVDLAGNAMDFYFYGTFPYNGSSTFVAAENNRLAEIKMTNSDNTEATVVGSVFTTNQTGTTLSFQYSEVIYYMVASDSPSGSAISMAHPDFPFTMTKITE